MFLLAERVGFALSATKERLDTAYRLPPLHIVVPLVSVATQQVTLLNSLYCCHIIPFDIMLPCCEFSVAQDGFFPFLAKITTKIEPSVKNAFLRLFIFWSARTDIVHYMIVENHVFFNTHHEKLIQLGEKTIRAVFLCIRHRAKLTRSEAPS